MSKDRVLVTTLYMLQSVCEAPMHKAITWASQTDSTQNVSHKIMAALMIRKKYRTNDNSRVSLTLGYRGHDMNF